MSIAGLHFRGGWLSLSLVLLMFVLLISLGCWQWGRALEKEALSSDFEQGQDDVALTVESDTRVDAFHYRRVQVTGHYDALRQFLLDNRTRDGVAGYNVITPLVLADGKTALLVNRGWTPVGADRTQLPEIPVNTQLMRVRGTLAPVPRVFLLGDDGHNGHGWPRVVQSLDYTAMEQTTGYRFLRAQLWLSAPADDPLIREWSAYYGITPERHRAYAVQWFGLATTLLILYVAVTLRRSKPKGENQS